MHLVIGDVTSGRSLDSAGTYLVWGRVRMLGGMEKMRRTGTRAELAAELRNDVGYWGFSGNDANLTAAVEGAHALEKTDVKEVTVGHTVYEVSD